LQRGRVGGLHVEGEIEILLRQLGLIAVDEIFGQLLVRYGVARSIDDRRLIELNRRIRIAGLTCLIGLAEEIGFVKSLAGGLIRCLGLTRLRRKSAPCQLKHNSCNGNGAQSTHLFPLYAGVTPSPPA
jgi:hypothetical protein